MFEFLVYANAIMVFLVLIILSKISIQMNKMHDQLNRQLRSTHNDMYQQFGNIWAKIEQESTLRETQEALKARALAGKYDTDANQVMGS